MKKTFKKLNITIKNFEWLDKVIELDNKLEVYKENIIQFVIYDKSTITAHGNSSISAYDNSTINAYDNSTITAYEKSNITGRDNSTINAHDNSNIIAYDNSSIYADGKSVVSAYGKSNITLSEFSFLTHNSTTIKITKNNWFGAEIKQVFKVKKDIVVFKKLRNDLICELLLKKGQGFQSENHSKCRTNKAVVLKIYDRETKEEHQTGFSRYDKAFEYKVGKKLILNTINAL